MNQPPQAQPSEVTAQASAAILTPGVWPDSIPAGRFAASVHRGAFPSPGDGRPRVALLGMPDDLGVRLNAGRSGAQGGPRAFREALARLGAAAPPGWNWPLVCDAGDVTPAPFEGPASPDNPRAVEALHQTHDRVTAATRSLASEGYLVVGIGGGHDLTFAFARGVIEAHRRSDPGAPFDVLYFDAHLDVRDTPGSGMGFRSLVERVGIHSLHCHGALPEVIDRAHLQWFQSHGGSWHPGPPEIDPASAFAGETPLVVSLDLDVLDQSYAPGVSALNPLGWSPAQLLPFLHHAGRSPRVKCLDIMELSSPHDDGGRTARLAAFAFLTFLRGLSERSA